MQKNHWFCKISKLHLWSMLLRRTSHALASQWRITLPLEFSHTVFLFSYDFSQENLSGRENVGTQLHGRSRRELLRPHRRPPWFPRRQNRRRRFHLDGRLRELPLVPEHLALRVRLGGALPSGESLNFSVTLIPRAHVAFWRVHMKSLKLYQRPKKLFVYIWWS